jgi:hypothetical protein
LAYNQVFAGVAAADYDSALTLLVDDFEDHLAALGERGLATATIDTAPWLFRKAVITDPEGNMITFAEDLSRGD